MTEDEAIELIEKYQSTDSRYKLKGNKLVNKVLKRCGYLPIAVDLIAGLQFESDEKWQELVNDFSKNNDTKNLLKTFELSIVQLLPEHAKMYRLLGVFEAVKIPEESFASLWKIGNGEATSILKKLRIKSLLKFEDKNRYYYCQHLLYSKYCIITCLKQIEQ